MVLYRGFSSQQYEYDKNVVLTDVQLVNRDLYTHIFTRLGERVMMPTFGTRIPDLLFEPMDQNTLDIIETDLQDVFDYDPRVELIGSIIITPDYDTKTVTATATLLYLELHFQGQFDINLQFQS